MNKAVRAPTSGRLLTVNEWAIVTRVFGSTLPMRERVIVTNGAGIDGRPFTIPTSLITSLPVVASTAFATFVTKIPLFLAGGALIAELMSVGNLAYLMN